MLHACRSLEIALEVEKAAAATAQEAAARAVASLERLTQRSGQVDLVEHNRLKAAADALRVRETGMGGVWPAGTCDLDSTFGPKCIILHGV